MKSPQQMPEISRHTGTPTVNNHNHEGWVPTAPSHHQAKPLCCTQLRQCKIFLYLTDNQALKVKFCEL